MRLTKTALAALARGAAVLGAGGGGDPYIGTLLAGQAIAQFGDVDLVALPDLPDDAHVLMVAMMGAPTVLVEKLPGVLELATPIAELERRLGRRFTHIVAGEVGGVNSLVPVAAAAVSGLPLLDADCIGRAFPELHMALPSVLGVPASPVAFSDERGNRGLIEADDPGWAERLTRALCVEVGSSMVFATYPMSGTTARSVLVEGSMSRCIALGNAIEPGLDEDPTERVLELLGGLPLLWGKVIDVQRSTGAGFARGTTSISDGLRTVELLFQNEFLVAREAGRSLVTSPDIIAVIDEDTGQALTTEALKYGQRVCVISAPADQRWHTPDGLARVGPAAFGYDESPRRYDGTGEPSLSRTLPSYS